MSTSNTSTLATSPLPFRPAGSAMVWPAFGPLANTSEPPAGARSAALDTPAVKLPMKPPSLAVNRPRFSTVQSPKSNDSSRPTPVDRAREPSATSVESRVPSLLTIGLMRKNGLDRVSSLKSNPGTAPASGSLSEPVNSTGAGR